jgi:hypothetical protein
MQLFKAQVVDMLRATVLTGLLMRLEEVAHQEPARPQEQGAVGPVLSDAAINVINYINDDYNVDDPKALAHAMSEGLGVDITPYVMDEDGGDYIDMPHEVMQHRHVNDGSWPPVVALTNINHPDLVYGEVVVTDDWGSGAPTNRTGMQVIRSYGKVYRKNTHIGSRESGQFRLATADEVRDFVGQAHPRALAHVMRKAFPVSDPSMTWGGEHEDDYEEID